MWQNSENYIILVSKFCQVSNLKRYIFDKFQWVLGSHKIKLKKKKKEKRKREGVPASYALLLLVADPCDTCEYIIIL